jgi:hypothetical protein
MDTSDHGLPQLISGLGPAANGLTGVGELFLRFQFELITFLSVIIHRGLKY